MGRLFPSSEDSRKVELEVKLPGVDPGRIFSFLICESQAQLDNFQKVNIAPKELILIVDGAAEFTYWPYNNPRKLCVLGKKSKSYFITCSTRSMFNSTLAGLNAAFCESLYKKLLFLILFHILLRILHCYKCSFISIYYVKTLLLRQ